MSRLEQEEYEDFIKAKVLNNIMKSYYQNQNENSRSDQGQMSTSEGDGGHQNFAYSSFASPQSTKESTITTNANIKATTPISPAISSSKIAAAPAKHVQPSTFLSPSANSASTTIATSSNANNEQFGAPGISSPAKLSTQKKSKKKNAAQTISNSETVNTAENPDTRKHELFGLWLTCFIMLFNGIFLLVVSSVFLSRLMQFSVYFSNFDWMILTIEALCLGALKIVLSLLGCSTMCLKDVKPRPSCGVIFGIFYGLTIIISGVLVILFMLTNCYGTTFLSLKDVEGRKNYDVYTGLIMALGIEPALFCVFILLLLVVGLICAIVNAAKKCL